MDLNDKEVMELRRKQMKEEYHDFEKGFYINNEIVEFERQIIYANKLSIMLPKSFVNMPMNMAKIKYPSEYRPQVIKTDLIGAVNITFNLFPKPITVRQIPGACSTLKRGIRNMNPANVFYEEGTSEIGNTVCSWFEYKSFALDGPIYNMLFVSSVGGNVLQGTFNCRFQDMNEWRDAAMQMRDSMIDLTLNSDGE